MARVTPPRTPEDFLNGYGLDWKPGVLSEHADLFEAAGGTLRGASSGSGRTWAVVDGVAYPVVCSEVIEIPTEDGKITGRCGLPATREGSCEAHAEQIALWRAGVRGGY